jgi:hypothetical protein
MIVQRQLAKPEEGGVRATTTWGAVRYFFFGR